MVRGISLANFATQASRIFDGLLPQLKNVVANKNVPKLSNVIRIKINGKEQCIVNNQRVDYIQSIWMQAVCGRGANSRVGDLISKFRSHFTINPIKRKPLVPFYALVGFVTYNNSSSVAENENLAYDGDAVSNDIKVAAKKLMYPKEDHVDLGTTLTDYQLCDYISKGSNAAVYHALHPNKVSEVDSVDYGLPGRSDDIDSESDFLVISESEDEKASYQRCNYFDDNENTELEHQAFLENWNPFLTVIPDTPSVDNLTSTATDGDFRDDLAIKVMFNMYTSNDGQIYEIMKNELLPLSHSKDKYEKLQHHDISLSSSITLPYHYNIIDIKQWFISDMPDIDFDNNFPAMLPTRLNPDGFGRNRTMFIVMERYDNCLEDIHHYDLCTRDSTMVFAQLIEASIHLSAHGIAHRDLKSNNILLKSTIHGVCPHAVMCDFGLAYVGTVENMRLSFPHNSMSRGGNPVLWAPEISTTTAGNGVYLDYSKSDLWALGTLAYEIFGSRNPFYTYNANDTPLRSRSYGDEQLPIMSAEVPYHVRCLVRNILNRNPKQRPSSLTVGDCLQMLLWLPDDLLNGLQTGQCIPSKQRIMRWIMILSAEVNLQAKTIDSVERQLKLNFLQRFRLTDFMQSVQYLWNL